MKNSAQNFFSNLNEYFSKIEAQNENGHNINLDKAFDLSLELIFKTKAAGKKVIFIGNGGSAAIASHQAVDFWKNGGVRAITFNEPSLLTCISNDYGYEFVFEKPIEMFADPDDVLIGISSSGQSQNILRGVQAAKLKKCSVITLSGFQPSNPLRSLGQLNFYVPSESYGFVEITHLAICHYLADQIMSQKRLSEVATYGRV